MWQTRRYLVACGVSCVVFGLAGCADVGDPALEGVGYCYGCDWIVQEWDDPGWSTHNSDRYDSEEACEEALAEQSRRSPDRGHRCIYESDLRGREEELPAASDFCYGCEWVVEVEQSGRWRAVDAAAHHTEGVCQQALWHAYKENPHSNYRCRNLDD